MSGTVCKVVWGDVVQYIRFGLASVIVCSMICCGLNISHSEYLVRNPVQAALQSYSKQKAIYFFFLAWLGWTLTPKYSFKKKSKSIPGGQTDGRLSDFDDIFILFRKMHKESCSRLGSKTDANYFGCWSLHVCLNKFKHRWD